MNPLFFISFGTVKGNLGCVVVKASDGVAAIEKASRLGINPGGEAAAWPIDESEAAKLPINKLIPPEFLRSMGYRSSREQNITPAQSAEFFRNATRVCQSCNHKH